MANKVDCENRWSSPRSVKSGAYGTGSWTDTTTPKRSVPKADLPFIKQMVQKRHILIHNGGVVDQDYLDKSGDTQVRLGERIRVCSKEAKRFIECVQTMGANFADNVECGFSEG
jgi:hypothetical protein